MSDVQGSSAPSVAFATRHYQGSFAGSYSPTPWLLRARTPITRSAKRGGSPLVSRPVSGSLPWPIPRRTILSALSAHGRRHARNVGSMKKAKSHEDDELRRSYKRSDFPGGFTRGKYAARLAA